MVVALIDHMIVICVVPCLDKQVEVRPLSFEIDSYKFVSRSKR